MEPGGGLNGGDKPTGYYVSWVCGVGKMGGTSQWEYSRRRYYVSWVLGVWCRLVYAELRRRVFMDRLNQTYHNHREDVYQDLISERPRDDERLEQEDCD